MSVHIIVAIDRSGAIGRQGDLLYRLRADLRRFKALTMGNTVIMGRRTWESLPAALPGRRNIVVTRNQEYKAVGAEIAQSLEQALAMASDTPGEIYIMGGAQLYAAAEPYADILDITLINDIAPNPDTYLEPFDLSDFKVVAVQAAYTDPSADFITLHRIF